VLVATHKWNRLTDKALSFALTISSDVYAIHLKAIEGPDAEENEQELREQWRIDVEEPARAAGLQPPKLLILESRYRLPEVPLLGIVEDLQDEDPERVVAVLIPELVKRTWWEYLLHTHRARRIRSALIKLGSPRLVVMNIPWHLGERKAADLEPELESELVQAEKEVHGIASQLRHSAGA
jgi:hypothetical protein